MTAVTAQRFRLAAPAALFGERVGVSVLGMPAAAVKLLDEGEVMLRVSGVRFPVELRLADFRPDELDTWPHGDGRFEYVDGRLLLMPPCADVQQYVAIDVAFVLRAWSASTPGFLVGGNEAGMKLGRDIRAADAAVWRRSEVGEPTGHLQSVAPVLAVEVAGRDEEESVLRAKAGWYHSHGVAVVWLVLPDTREVVVITAEAEHRYGLGGRLAEDDRLPGLVPEVARFFGQLGPQ